MRLIAELTIPKAGSWNGLFTGPNEIRTITFTSSGKEHIDKIGKYSYDFNDGWIASIEIREPKPKEKVTGNFFSYYWMLESIKKHGKIIRVC